MLPNLSIDWGLEQLKSNISYETLYDSTSNHFNLISVVQRKAMHMYIHTYIHECIRVVQKGFIFVLKWHPYKVFLLVLEWHLVFWQNLKKYLGVPKVDFYE